AGCPGAKDQSTGGATSSTTTAPAGGGAGAPAAAAGEAKITGKIKWDGAVPAAKPIDMSGTAECAAQHKDAVNSETISIKDGNLQNVIVYVKEGLKGTF